MSGKLFRNAMIVAVASTLLPLTASADEAG